MARFTIAVLIIISAFLSVDCDPKTTRVSVKDYGFVVSVMSEDEHLCIGTILDDEHVLTTALCATGNKPTNLKVRVGIDEPLANGSTFKVQKVFQHPLYKWGKFIGDIAILKLESAIPNPKPVKLATKYQKTDFLDLVGGWGHFPDQNSVRPLQKYRIRTVERSVCNNSYVKYGVIKRLTGFMCAGGGREFCKTESSVSRIHQGQTFGGFGDLLLDKDVLMGIAAVIPCVLEHAPGLFTFIPRFLKWIKSILGLPPSAPLPLPPKTTTPPSPPPTKKP
ncbi:trypsin-4-like [Periplaneta americana]|uniref:trypsin-4-like n=1 Tax=Periplaneta americana TaxID=6978 RepID=UPI0037E716CC